MRKYQPPAREFFRLPNKIFQVPLDATQFKLYAYLPGLSICGTKVTLGNSITAGRLHSVLSGGR